MKALFDADTLIDSLDGVEAAREELGRYANPMISAIGWMAVMVGTSDVEQDTVRAFLSRFNQVSVDARVAEIALTLRRSHTMRLPDAIIRASARKEDAPLVSRNTKDFPADAPGIRIPSTL